MICPYCKEKEGTKSNTHYLSDNIIRTALNSGGSKDRDKGLYFDMSNSSGAVKFNFQQSTPQQKLEDNLGRPPNEEEIEEAKKRLFSVDNIFCPDCEKAFGVIERAFDTAILPKFREAELEGVLSMDIVEIRVLRTYFYLQLWRSSICDKTFQLPTEIEDDLRNILLNNVEIDSNEITKYPLSITYLVNNEEGETKTQNLVGCTSGGNPYLILMNDFIIQFFEDEGNVIFFDFNGLNSDDYLEYINQNEDVFKVKVFSDSERIEFNVQSMGASKGQAFISMLVDDFSRMFNEKFGHLPDKEIIGSFISTIINQDKPMAIKFSTQELEKETIEYLKNLSK